MTYTIYTPDGRRATIASFLTREGAEMALRSWREREARGGRPDITTEGLYVAEEVT